VSKIILVFSIFIYSEEKLLRELLIRKLFTKIEFILDSMCVVLFDQSLQELKKVEFYKYDTVRLR
jgi:hypothetical protein